MAHRPGFTLLEVLVALAVTAVFSGLILAVTTGALAGWERAGSRLTLENRASAVLERLAADLAAADLEPAAGRRLAFETSEAATTVFGCFTRQPAVDAAGDRLHTVREVRYVLAPAAGGLAHLYRLEGSAGTALGSGYAWSLADVMPTEADLLARGVARFTLRLRDGAGRPVDAGSAAPPVFAEATLEFVSEDGERRLEAIAAGRTHESGDLVRAATARRVQRRLVLRAVTP